MQIQFVDGPDWLATISGEVDADNCEQLTQAVKDNNGNVRGSLVLDISKMTFIDSSGISTLLKIKQDLEGHGSSLTLMKPTDSVHRVLEITGLLETFGLET